MAIRKGDYGAVVVINGIHKGKSGYYDDDQITLNVDKFQAMVYFGEPFEGQPIICSYNDLEKLNRFNMKAFLDQNPKFSQWIGVGNY